MTARMRRTIGYRGTTVIGQRMPGGRLRRASAVKESAVQVLC
jgi:hypothetical protein